MAEVINFDKFQHRSLKIRRAQNTDELTKQVSKFDRALTRHRRKFKKQHIKLSDAKANIAILESLLNMTLGLVGIAEEQFYKYKNERGAYCINALVNQVRELQNDLRQLRTGEKQQREIVNKIILPNLSILMQQYMTSCSELKKQVNKLDRDNRQRMIEALNSSMQQQGNLFNDVSTKMQQGLAEYLVA